MRNTAGWSFMLCILSSCNDDGIGNSNNEARDNQSVENQEAGEEKMPSWDVDFDAGLWLTRISDDEFAIRESAGDPKLVISLKKTQPRLNYEGFAKDDRIEGVMVVIESSQGHGGEYKKIQIRHIPIIDGRVKISNNMDGIYVRPEVIMGRIADRHNGRSPRVSP